MIGQQVQLRASAPRQDRMWPIAVTCVDLYMKSAKGARMSRRGNAHIIDDLSTHLKIKSPQPFCICVSTDSAMLPYMRY